MNLEAKEIKLYEQYRRNEPVKEYFSFLRDYIQEKYFDMYYIKINEKYQAAKYVKELNIKTGISAYLYFYALNILGVHAPYINAAYYTYDVGLKYDSGYTYDSGSIGERVSLTVFKKILAFVYNWGIEDWNVITLSQLIANFCEIDFVSINDIKVDYSQDRFNTFVVSVPKTNYSEILQTLFRMSADNTNVMAVNVFNFPVGMKVELVLYEETP